MNTISLMQKILGDDWSNLPSVIQRHYQLQTGHQTANVVAGTMHVRYPRFVRPMLFLTRLMGGLIDLQGDHLAVRVEKWLDIGQPDTLFWKRTIQAPDGKTTVFASRMVYQQGNELIEYVGGGFGLYLNLTVENNMLIYRSNGHLWQIMKLISEDYFPQLDAGDPTESFLMSQIGFSLTRFMPSVEEVRTSYHSGNDGDLARMIEVGELDRSRIEEYYQAWIVKQPSLINVGTLGQLYAENA